jgi:hypothetical protein
VLVGALLLSPRFLLLFLSPTGLLLLSLLSLALLPLLVLSFPLSRMLGSRFLLVAFLLVLFPDALVLSPRLLLLLLPPTGLFPLSLLLSFLPLLRRCSLCFFSR